MSEPGSEWFSFLFYPFIICRKEEMRRVFKAQATYTVLRATQAKQSGVRSQRDHSASGDVIKGQFILYFQYLPLQPHNDDCRP